MLPTCIICLLGLTPANQPLISWDVSNVTNMYNLFHNAFEFNQDIAVDVSNVTDMGSCFIKPQCLINISG